MVQHRGAWLALGLAGCSLVHAPDDPVAPFGGGSGGTTTASGAAAGMGGEGALGGGAGAVGGGAAGGAGGGQGAMGGTGGGGDTVAPTILAITPPDGTTGLSANVSIVVQWSEPMAQTATEAAYESSDIPPAGVAFSWNGAGDVLTIDPASGLAYAAGTDPATLPPLEYAFSLTTAATDLAGNPLAVQVDSSFFTLREITTTVGANLSLSGDVRADGNPNGCVGGDPCAGDSGSLPNAQYVGLLSYDISALPDGIESFASAVLTTSQVTLYDSPYATMGVVLLEHVEFNALDGTAFNAPALASLGVLSSNANLESKSASVTSAVATNYADPSPLNGYSQYRLRFTQPTDNDGTFDAAVFDRDASTLALVYLLP